MSPADKESIENSGEQSQQNEKLVSVNEAIKYRKRAQNAEQKYQQLEQEFSQNKQQLENLNNELRETQYREELVRALAAEGVIDVETAVLVGKARLEKNNEIKIADVVTQLKKEKTYLFISEDDRKFSAPPKTAGAKEKLPRASAALERAAKKAVESGSRAALQEYLRMRRMPLGR